MKIELKKILKTNIDRIDKQIKEEIITRNSAPTPIQSGSDKTRQVAEQMIDSLHQEKKDLLVIKKTLVNLPKFNQNASVNTLVTLHSYGKEKIFLLVPEGMGGVSVDEVFLLSIKSPLVKKFIGKNLGFKFNFNNSPYKIVSIQPN